MDEKISAVVGTGIVLFLAGTVGLIASSHAASKRGAEDAKFGFPPREDSHSYLIAYKEWYDCQKHFLETGYTLQGELKKPVPFKGVE
jgi:hypothetical protein